MIPKMDKSAEQGDYDGCWLERILNLQKYEDYSFFRCVLHSILMSVIGRFYLWQIN